MKEYYTSLIVGSALSLIVILGFKSRENKNEKIVMDGEQVGQIQPEPNQLREAYFGDLHLHTNLSFDAYLGGATVGPEQAYQFARGDSINYLGGKIRYEHPLDFLAVTDHSEYMGVSNTVEDEDGNNELAKTSLGKKMSSKDPKIRMSAMWRISNSFSGQVPVDELANEQEIKNVWKREKDAANKYYQPGKFTTFLAYEYSSIPDGRNLHRNVIFKGDKAPDKPFSSVESINPEDLWTYLESNRKLGFESLAITHNANVSDGSMFDLNDSYGVPITEAYAKRRIENEPLAEVIQSKGSSETHPGLSPNDEFANFELYVNLLTRPRIGKLSGSYYREALGRGIQIEQKVGANPYEFGAIGASDFHNGLSTPEENNGGPTGYYGPGTKPVKIKDFARVVTGSSGLTGVWAEQNTREAIYNALKRKEVFATSGTRLKLRFFSGWKYNRNLLKTDKWVKDAYAQGVPMGAELPAKPAGIKAPQFVVWAIKDPNSGNLDRIQVIKIWVKNGKSNEKIFDVAYAGNRKPDPKSGKLPPIGNTVDLKAATYTNTIGSTELGTVWVDPEFDPSLPSVYYLRVLEIPTPRWSTILAVKNEIPLPKEVPATIQERGFSSPIWYKPVKN